MPPPLRPMPPWPASAPTTSCAQLLGPHRSFTLTNLLASYRKVFKCVPRVDEPRSYRNRPSALVEPMESRPQRFRRRVPRTCTHHNEVTEFTRSKKNQLYQVASHRCRMPRSTGLARIVIDAAIKLQRYAATGYYTVNVPDSRSPQFLSHARQCSHFPPIC